MRVLRVVLVTAGVFGLFVSTMIGLSVFGSVIGRVCTRAAFAQTSRMKFEEANEDSVRAFEERRARREHERATSGVPVPPDQPDDPDAPDTPEAPDAPSSGDIVRIGSDIHVDKNQTVDGDVIVFGADAEVDGHVRGNVSVTRGDVRLGSSAKVDGDVLCIGGEIEEEDGATVLGQRVTGLQRGANRRTRIHRNVSFDDEDRMWSHPAKVARRTTYLLLWLALAWAIARFAAGRTARALDTMKREIAASFGMGFALLLLLIPSVIAMALVVAILCITIIGIPVALGVIIAYALLLLLLGGWGYVVGAAALGQRIAGRSGNPPTLVRSAVVGVLAIQGTMLVATMLRPLPIIGWTAGVLWVLAMVVYSAVTLVGVGALIRSKFGQGEGGQWWPPSRLFGSSTPPAPAGWPAPGTPGTQWTPDVPPQPAASAPPPYVPPTPVPPPAPPSSFAPPPYTPPPQPQPPPGEPPPNPIA
jgi:hypothetical protein